LLLENDGKPARERLTLIRVFEQLRGLGYEGGYDAVRREPFQPLGTPIVMLRQSKHHRPGARII